MEEVKDVLHDIEKWAEAYEILKEWADGPCKNSECEKCGFLQFCDKASNLVNK